MLNDLWSDSNTWAGSLLFLGENVVIISGSGKTAELDFLGEHELNVIHVILQ